MNTVTKAGRYELREELGRGAMGVVYHAHDPVIGREVAVKTMRLSTEGTGMTREELISRFQTEARAAGLLSHPNIVVIFDAGEEEGLFYITMEMVEGRSLQTMIDGRQLFPLPRVMKLMEQVCSALDFAHQHHVVHRDIKPANLVLTADDTVKITDFGTAKILQFGTAQTAHVMGTPSYMSPEQVKGKPVDGRSDIFSLGVILYELMTGEKPFPGQNITTVIYKIINEDPISPRSLDSSIHPGLSAVITRALAKDPNARFQSCQELLGALKNYRELVSPEPTVRMAPANAVSASEGFRGSTPTARASATPLIGMSNALERPLQHLSTATLDAEESSTGRSTLFLSILLLGVIGYAGYRVWPPMLDLWQRAHEPIENAQVQPNAAPITPAGLSDIPDTKADSRSDSISQAPLPAIQTPISAAPESSVIPQPAQSEPPSMPAPAVQHVPALTPAQSLTAAVPPVAVKEPTSPARPPLDAPGPAAATNAVETRLRYELARLALTDKVKVQVTLNALTLSGQVTPAEHLMLLNRLHWVPARVRVIDDLEYANDVGQSIGAASVGWVWARSEPQGAEIFVDGADTGMRTPARVQMAPGEHQLHLELKGYLGSQRTVVVHQSQTIQFTDPLAQQ